MVDSLARVTSTFKKNHVYQWPCIIIDNLPRTPPQPTLPLLPDPAIFLLLLYLLHTHLHLGNCTVDLLPQERPRRLAPPARGSITHCCISFVSTSRYAGALLPPALRHRKPVTNAPHRGAHFYIINASLQLK